MLGKKIYKYMLGGALLAAPVFASAQGWDFVGGTLVNDFSGKNTDASFLERFADKEKGHQEGHKVVLYKGEPLSACRLFNNLTPGFYDITATLSAPSVNGVCFLFGKGEGYSMASTAVPVGSNLKVTVRGVGTLGNSLLAGLFSDGADEVQVADLEVTKSDAFHFYHGGDITELNYVLDYGGRYADEKGNTLCPSGASREEMAQNVINYLAGNGMNFVRIRLSNNPGQPDNTGTYCLPEGYQDESDCLQLAKMANEAGMDIQFTFNWSDYWSNGTRQNVPADWLEAVKKAGAGNEVATLADCAYNYTKKVMQHLAALGIYPAYVSLGNETNGGFLFPYAYSYDVKAADASADMPQGYKNWTAIAKIVNAGYKAVKEVSPNSQVIIHLADNTYDVVDKAGHVDWWTYSWYFDELKKAGANFDVIGASYYPSWSTATAAQAAQFYAQLINRYKKDILVMETGYNWTERRKDGHEGQLPYTAPDYKQRYLFDKNGQKGFMADVLNELKGVAPGNVNHVVGDLYWDPMMIHVEDPSGKNATGWAHWYKWNTPDANVVENTTLFDFEGRALPVFDAYRYNRNCKPLKQHAVSADGGAVVSAEKAFYGDSVHVSWTKQEDMRVDSVGMKTDKGLTVYSPIAESATFLDVEMPDADATFMLYCSKKENTRAIQVELDVPLTVVAVEGGISLTSGMDCEAEIHTATGVHIGSYTLSAGMPVFVSVPAGVYVVGNKKVVVK